MSLVVSKESAISARAGLKGPIEGDVFFDTDHSGLVRYASRDDEHYRTVVDFLQQFVQSAKISTPEILDVISGKKTYATR